MATGTLAQQVCITVMQKSDRLSHSLSTILISNGIVLPWKRGEKKGEPFMIEKEKEIFFFFLKSHFTSGAVHFFNSQKDCRVEVMMFVFFFPSEKKERKKIITGPARKGGVSCELHRI